MVSLLLGLWFVDLRSLERLLLMVLGRIAFQMVWRMVTQRRVRTGLWSLIRVRLA